MLPDRHSGEKLALAHREQLQREAVHERLLGALPEHSSHPLLRIGAKHALSSGQPTCRRGSEMAERCEFIDVIVPIRRNHCRPRGGLDAMVPATSR